MFLSHLRLRPPPSSLAHTHPQHPPLLIATRLHHLHLHPHLHPRLHPHHLQRHCVAGSAPLPSSVRFSSRCSARQGFPIPQHATSSPKTSTCPQGQSKSGSRTKGSGPWQLPHLELPPWTTMRKMLTMSRQTCLHQPPARHLPHLSRRCLQPLQQLELPLTLP